MERFEGSHASINSAWLAMSVCIPAFSNGGRSGVCATVAFVIEGDGLETTISIFDIGARSDSIIFEED